MDGFPIRLRETPRRTRPGVDPSAPGVGLVGEPERGRDDDARGWLAPVVPLHPGSASGDGTRADTIVEIYEAEHLGLFRFARAVTGDDEAAEDILQEAFVRLIREVAAGRLPANVHAWLFRVATNLVVSSARRARTAERHLGDIRGDQLAESPEQVVLDTERDASVQRALADLPVDARAALLLAAQGFSGREIAQTLGRTEGAVRTLLCRSRLKVRQRLAPDLHSSGLRSS